MMRGKKVISVILALLSAFMMFGCKNTQASTDRITVWIMPGSQPAYFAWAKEEFEKNNAGLKVNIVSKAAGDLGDKLDATLSKKNAPDIAVTYGGIIVPILVKNNRLMDLTPIFSNTADGASIESKLNDGALMAKQDGKGKFYSAPLAGVASPLIFYNKTMFNTLKNSDSLSDAQKATIKEPETYAELKALCDTLRSQEKEPIAAGLGGWHLPHLMQTLAGSTMTKTEYQKLLKQGSEENPFAQASFKNSFDLLNKYVSVDRIFSTNASGTDVAAAENMFLNGIAGMYMGISLDYHTLESSTTADIGAFYLPSDNPIGESTDNPRASGVYSDALVVNKNANNKDIVTKFIKFLYSETAQQRLGATSLFPCIKGTDDSLMPDALKPIWKSMDEHGFVDFYQNWSYPGVDKRLMVAASGFLNGDTSTVAANRMITFYNDAKNASNI